MLHIAASLYPHRHRFRYLVTENCNVPQQNYNEIGAINRVRPYCPLPRYRPTKIGDCLLFRGIDLTAAVRFLTRDKDNVLKKHF